MSDHVIFRDVEKQYGGLRPLRVRDLRIPAGDCSMLIGFDRPAAETFVNLITGAVLPDKGDVISLGRPTAEIVDSDEWLTFVERFGIASDRVVLLEALTVAQNLAISFDLQLDPIPPDVLANVATLAAEVGIVDLSMPIGNATSLVRTRVHLARALALNPAVILLEHPGANLSADEVKEYAATLNRVHEKRRLTTIGLLMDERFAKATGGRLLFWQPATGDIRERRRFYF